jgi:hypothetical protein
MSELFAGTRQARYLIGVLIRLNSRLETPMTGKDTSEHGAES